MWAKAGVDDAHIEGLIDLSVPQEVPNDPEAIKKRLRDWQERTRQERAEDRKGPADIRPSRKQSMWRPELLDEESVSLDDAMAAEELSDQRREALHALNVAVVDYAHSFPRRYVELVLALGWMTNLDTGEAHASYKTLQRKIGENLQRLVGWGDTPSAPPAERTIGRQVQELREKGILATEQKHGKIISSRRGYVYHHPKTFATNTWWLDFSRTLDKSGDPIPYDFPFTIPWRPGSNSSDEDTDAVSDDTADQETSEAAIAGSNDQADAEASITTFPTTALPTNSAYRTDLPHSTTRTVHDSRRPQDHRSTRQAGQQHNPQHHIPTVDYAEQDGLALGWQQGDQRWSYAQLDAKASAVCAYITSTWPQAQRPRRQVLRSLMYRLLDDGYEAEEICRATEVWISSVDQTRRIESPAALLVDQLRSLVDKQRGWAPTDFWLADLLSLLDAPQRQVSESEAMKAIDYFQFWDGTWGFRTEQELALRLDTAISRTGWPDCARQRWAKCKDRYLGSS